MPAMSRRRITHCLCCLALAALTLPNTGCLAAAIVGGVAGAGAAGYAYYQGAVPRDYPATLDQTYPATLQALQDLGMPVVKAERDNDGAVIESKTGADETVKIWLEPRAAQVPADGQWTHVVVRVAIFGDGAFSERLLNQIDARLPRPAVPAGGGGASVPVVTAPPANQTGPPPQ